MFGFGKRKKHLQQFETLVTSVFGTYMIMRSLSQHRFEETKLEPMALQAFEGCYILGGIDALAHGIDLNEESIKQDDIIQMFVETCSGYEIFTAEESRGVVSLVILLIADGNAAHELMYLGAKDATDCSAAMMAGEDSSVAAKAMSPDYLDDKELIKKFKTLMKDFMTTQNLK